MPQIVSITSQGQITIPAKLRWELGLHRYNKAIVKRRKNGIVVEPVEDVLDFYGALADKAIKGKSINEIIDLEEQAWGKEAGKRYKRSLSASKRSLSASKRSLSASKQD